MISERPWGIKEHAYIYSQDDFRIGECFSESWTGKTRTQGIDNAEHIIACVNAIHAAGIQPSDVAVMVEAVRARWKQLGLTPDHTASAELLRAYNKAADEARNSIEAAASLLPERKESN